MVLGFSASNCSPKPASCCRSFFVPSCYIFIKVNSGVGSSCRLSLCCCSILEKKRKEKKKKKGGKKNDVLCVTVMSRLRAGRSSQRGNFSLHLRLSRPLPQPGGGIKAAKLLLFRVFRRGPRPHNGRLSLTVTSTPLLILLGLANKSAPRRLH